LGQGELVGRVRGPTKKPRGSGLPRLNGLAPARCSLRLRLPAPELLPLSPMHLPLSPKLLSLISFTLCSALVAPLRSCSLSDCVPHVRVAWRGAEECVKTLLRWARTRRVDLVVHVGWRKHAPRHCEGEAIGLHEERSPVLLWIWREIPCHGVCRAPARCTRVGLALTACFSHGCFFLPVLKVSSG
jgi:hypothetical protein